MKLIQLKMSMRRLPRRRNNTARKRILQQDGFAAGRILQQLLGRTRQPEMILSPFREISGPFLVALSCNRVECRWEEEGRNTGRSAGGCQ